MEENDDDEFELFEVLQFCMSTTTTQLPSSVEFFKLRYDTKPNKSASSNDSFYNNYSKIAKLFSFDIYVAFVENFCLLLYVHSGKEHLLFLYTTLKPTALCI